MDTSFDLVDLLQQEPSAQKSHKIRPTQFVSVAGGIQKRLETNIKNRKSSRLSVFDRIRNISKCKSPKAPVLSDAQQKAMHRKQQLEKWKEENAKKKKDAAAQKKKPFVAGVSHRQTFGPPPLLPSMSGRVTRSQARQKAQPKPQAKSFAPSNAAFQPCIRLTSEVPTLAPVNNKKVSKAKTNITFEPVLPKNLQKETRTTQATRAKPTVKPVVDTKKKPNDTTKIKATLKPPPLKHQLFQSSSSSSDSEQPSKLRTRSNLRKSIPTIQDKPIPQESTTQDSACVLQETASMSSQDSDSTSQDASMSLDTASSQDKLHTPRVKVPKSESSLEEKLQLTPEQIVEEARNDSPRETLSRGKANARKEVKKKYDEGLLDEDSSNMHSVNRFRLQLNSEIARITAMCHTWDQIFAKTVLPESIQEQILCAVGQARLLMSQKMQQFAGLVENCENPLSGAKLVTPADLHGFWNMVFMQVEDVDNRFKSLEELRLRNWIEEQKPEVKKVVPKPVLKKVVPKPSGGPSRLREVIAAARKAKQAQESQSDNSGSEKSEATVTPETKTFEAGFFKISSPLKKSTPATPSNKSTLMKSVLSSEAKKSVSKNSASFAMLRASSLGKHVDIEGMSPLPQTACVLQETASMSSKDSDSTSQDASMSQDTASSQDELHTPRVKVPKSESSSEEKLRSPKTVEIQLTPEPIVEEARNESPRVTLSQGKANARKEVKKKYDEGLLDEDSSNMHSVNRFRLQLNSEIARITAMCHTWDQIFAETVLPESIQEQILCAVGQALLLMSQKMQRFAGLVENCENPLSGAKLVTPAYLHGYWNMVFMQVEDVDNRFKSLEELRLRNWIEEQKPEVKKVVPKPVLKKVVPKPSGGPSRLREVIAAARKAKQAQESQSDNSGSEKSEATVTPETKTFEAGFFKISSPLKKSTPATPSNKSTLMKSVLSSEAKKSVSKNSASFAMLRASSLGKHVDIEGISPLPQTPIFTESLYAAPAPSILKQANPISSKKSEKLKAVPFYFDEPSSPTCTSCENPGVAPLPDEDKKKEKHS